MVGKRGDTHIEMDIRTRHAHMQNECASERYLAGTFLAKCAASVGLGASVQVRERRREREERDR